MPMHTSRTRAFRFVVPPCFAPTSQSGPFSVQDNRYACAMTGAPVAALCTMHSVRGSKTMFSALFRTPSHLPGLSATYLRAYSSFHCLCQRYSIFSGIALSLPRRSGDVNDVFHQNGAGWRGKLYLFHRSSAPSIPGPLTRLPFPPSPGACAFFPWG